MSSIRSSCATVSWQVPTEIQKTPHSFLLLYCTETSDAKSFSTEACSADITDLEPGTDYTVEVYAELQHGGKRRVGKQRFTTGKNNFSIVSSNVFLTTPKTHVIFCQSQMHAMIRYVFSCNNPFVAEISHYFTPRQVQLQVVSYKMEETGELVCRGSQQARENHQHHLCLHNNTKKCMCFCIKEQAVCNSLLYHFASFAHEFLCVFPYLSQQSFYYLLYGIYSYTLKFLQKTQC